MEIQNIGNKADHPAKVEQTQNIPSKNKITAEEINTIVETLANVSDTDPEQVYILNKQ